MIKNPNDAKLWVLCKIPTPIVRYILTRSKNQTRRIDTNSHQIPLSNGLLSITKSHKSLAIFLNSPTKALVWRNSFLDIKSRTVR